MPLEFAKASNKISILKKQKTAFLHEYKISSLLVNLGEKIFQLAIQQLHTQTPTSIF